MLHASLRHFQIKFRASLLPLDGKQPHPQLGGWKSLQTQRLPIAQLRAWVDGGATGLGCILGEASADAEGKPLVVIDFDDREAYRNWRSGHLEAARSLPTVITARGFHVYARGPAAYHQGEGFEYRGTSGHYVAIPGSEHPSGAIYSWRGGAAPDTLPVIDPVDLGLLPATPVTTGRKARPQGLRRIAGRTPVDLENELWPQADLTGPLPSRPRGLWLHTWHQARILRCVPLRPGRRNHCILKLVRTLRGFRHHWSSFTIRQAFDFWWERARPAIGTQEYSTSWRDLCVGWLHCTTPKKRLRAGTLIQESLEVTLPPEALTLRPREQSLLTCCVVLGRKTGGRFYLSREDMMRLTGCSSKFVLDRSKRALLRGGWIREVRKADHRRALATQYQLGDWSWQQ